MDAHSHLSMNRRVSITEQEISVVIQLGFPVPDAWRPGNGACFEDLDSLNQQQNLHISFKEAIKIILTKT